MGLLYPLLALLNLFAGGFLVVATYAFDPATTTHIGFGVSIGVVVISLGMAYYAWAIDNDEILTTLSGLTAALAAWTVIATTTFEPTTAQWMVFSSGIAHMVLAAASLLAHEASVQRPPRRRRTTAARRR
jgi:uncharacterized membrane protein